MIRFSRDTNSRRVRAGGAPPPTYMSFIEDNPSKEPPQRERWAFTFSIEGDLRFLSHRDTVRLFERALARSALPIRFTEGFNPHPRLSLPVPRALGIASQAETIIIEFDQPIDGDDATTRLAAQLPGAISLSHTRRLDPGERLHPELVRYRLEPPDAAETAPAPPSDLSERINKAMCADTLVVERKGAPGEVSRSIDVRPFLVEMFMAGGDVEFTLRITPAGTARPREIAGLLGFDADTITHHIRRIEVRWRKNTN